MTSLCSQERDSLAAIATNLLVNGYVLFRYLALSGAGALEGADATKLWAQVVLWAIPAHIGIAIFLIVLLTYLSGERLSGMVADERDRLFRLRGMSTTSVVFGLGFAGAMVGLALGWSPVTGVIAIYVSATVADLVGNLVRFASYRLGS